MFLLFSRRFATAITLLCSLQLHAQSHRAIPARDIDTDDPSTYWQELDPKTDGLYGVASRSALDIVPPNRKATTVVVAVIDSEVDTEHEDLKDNIWINEDEIPGNGLDDDQNGYADDVHGWNFLGSPDGRNIEYETLEVTRLYRELNIEFGNKKKSAIEAKDRERYEYYLSVKEDYEEKLAMANENMEYLGQLIMIWNYGIEQLGSLLPEKFTLSDLNRIHTGNEEIDYLAALMSELMSYGLDPKALDEMVEETKTELKYNLNLQYNPREIVGDRPEDLDERYYGNALVSSGQASHGTHVSGLIAANNQNGIGINGIGGQVQIMVLRAVPDGDERDKDVANAIMYAVENGAHIINCSFGKSWSPHKEVVDRAVRFAEKEGVLIVHGSGNDGLDLDENASYPNRYYADGSGAARNWLEVGASASVQDMNWASDFSNYGDESVDLFAPGVDLLSTVPGNKYKYESGTSMASPVVAGVAALVLSYYPELTASQLRDILIASSLKYEKQKVYVPNLDGKLKKTKFGKLCISAGLVNAKGAMQLAEQLTGSSVHKDE